MIYENKLSKNFFVNVHGSELMTTVLVAVNKKKIELFKEQYMSFLMVHRQNDFENWAKRQKAQINVAINAAKDKDLQREISEKEY